MSLTQLTPKNGWLEDDPFRFWVPETFQGNWLFNFGCVLLPRKNGIGRRKEHPPRTQMTLAFCLEKALVLRGWPSKIEVIGVLTRHRYFGCLWLFKKMATPGTSCAQRKSGLNRFSRILFSRFFCRSLQHPQEKNGNSWNHTKKHLTFFNRNDHVFKISGSSLPSKMIISKSKSQKSPVLFRSSEHHTFPCAMPPAALRVALYQYLLVVQTKPENREKNEKLVCEDDLKWVVRMAHSSDTSKWKKRSMPNFYQILWGRILENQMEIPDEKNLLWNYCPKKTWIPLWCLHPFPSWWSWLKDISDLGRSLGSED